MSLTRNPNLDLNPSTETASELRGGKARNQPLAFPRGENWWTGPNPLNALQGAEGLHALPIPNLKTCTRAEVQAYFDNGWMLTELLFACLINEDAFYRPPYHNLRHPLIFYYTHPAVLYVNKLNVAGLIDTTVHPYHERLFETGVDEMSWDDLSKNEMDWPDMKHCQDYRQQCYDIVTKIIKNHPGLRDGHEPITMDSPLWALFMGFEHERIHLETSSVLIRELPAHLVKRHPGFAPLHPSAKAFDPQAVWKDPVAGRDYPANPWVKKGRSSNIIGKDPAFPTFGWDNEYGQRLSKVEAFAAQRQQVSNGEFHEFVSAGGYREKKYWTDEGWRWRTFRNVKWPVFWVPCGPQGAHEYALRTCFEMIQMPWDWPVTVNYHEAKAYAAWKSSVEKRTVPLRLLTEAEHHALRTEHAPRATDDDIEALYKAMNEKGVNSSLRFGSESPVGGRAAEEFTDVFGNNWQWLEDHFHFLPGFTVHSLYDDFSTPCFDGLHQMIVGGSFISAGDEASLHARFHFRPHFTQHAGFRLVDPLHAGNHGDLQTIQPHEDEVKDEHKSRQQQLFTAFANGREIPADSMIAAERMLRNVVLQQVQRHIGRSFKVDQRFIEVGSGVGGLSYQLAELGARTIGVDISKLAIDAAKDWQNKAAVVCRDPDTGAELQRPLNRAVLEHLSWRQSDASSLPAEYFDFDFVVLNRVLSQLPSPKSLLGRLGGERGLVKPGGYVFIADRFAWSERSTPRTLWISEDPKELGEALGSNFKLVDSGECFHVERPAKDLAAVGRLHFTLWRRQS